MDYAFGEEMVWAVKMSKVIIARCAKYTHDVCIKKKKVAGFTNLGLILHI